MNKRLIEYHEIGSNIILREQRDMEIALAKLKYMLELQKCLKR